jgi:hypothetical protein
MEAKPRLPPSHNAAKSKGHLLQTRVMTGRHERSRRQRGPRRNQMPVSKSQDSTIPRGASHQVRTKRDAPERNNDSDHAMTARKATQRDLKPSHSISVSPAPHTHPVTSSGFRHETAFRQAKASKRPDQRDQSRSHQSTKTAKWPRCEPTLDKHTARHNGVRITCSPTVRP